MGKNKRGAVRGLSSYVFESFKSELPTLPTSNLDSESNPGQAVNGANLQDPGNPAQEERVEVESRPTKKRKANDGSEIVVQEQPILSIQDGKWIKAYDATGLVPHYSNAAEVPEHLQKCMFPIRLHLMWPHVAQTFHSARDTSRYTHSPQDAF
jgi:trimethylguanosine synthase